MTALLCLGELPSSTTHCQGIATLPLLDGVHSARAGVSFGLMASSALSSPKDNRLLAALPAAEYDALAASSSRCRCRSGRRCTSPAARCATSISRPTRIVSLLYVMEDGASAEIAVVGNEGLVGISLFMGGETTPSRAVVQSAGHGYRLKASTLKDEFNRGGPLQHLLLRYTQALITQMAQTAVCNRHHSVDQQLCRWLLLSLDRLPSNELVMTQELIANMLGVRREGVTEAAGKLQEAGLIDYSRGRITVLDRPGVWRRASCECYPVVKTELRPPAACLGRARPADPSPARRIATAPSARCLWQISETRLRRLAVHAAMLGVDCEDL